MERRHTCVPERAGRAELRRRVTEPTLARDIERETTRHTRTRQRYVGHAQKKKAYDAVLIPPRALRVTVRTKEAGEGFCSSVIL